MPEGKLSCWNRYCPEDCNENETCIKDGVDEAKYCRNFVDAPWNLEMNKK